MVASLEVPALVTAFAGADAVAHLAQIGAGAPDAYEAVNVEGTRQVAEAAARAGVARIAYFSGLGTARYGMAPRTTNRYFLSKLGAERALYRSPLAVDVFRPSYVIGPGDALIRALVAEIAGGVVERPGDGSYRMQPIAIADAAAALLTAAGSGPGGDPPHRVLDLVGPEPVAYDRLVARVAARAGARGLPDRYTTATVSIEEADRRARGEAGYRGLQPDELDCLLCDEIADAAPLARFLGRALTGLDAALDVAIDAALSSSSG